ncbi:MAG TPA: thiamine diphosphokinase [Ktedonobacteraceae bacterium]|nr:thiamine diphosphokinase [Ktedonobacteraceae bacterium]
MHIVIFAGGTVQAGQAITRAIASAQKIVTADSGTETALRYGCAPDLIVGDLDSLAPERIQQLRNQGKKFKEALVEKNETDTELAIQSAIELGATSITLLGALGGARFDHTFANFMLLAGYPEFPITIVDGPSSCWLLKGPGQTNVSGKPEDLVSLLPLTAEVTGIKTHDLYYPLNQETLYFGKPRGVSNQLTHTNAEITIQSGMLLIIHTDTHELNELMAKTDS